MTSRNAPATARRRARRPWARALVALAVVAATLTACSALTGREYPTDDPTTVITRVQARSQWAYEAMELPDATPVEGGRFVASHTCYKRWAIDEADHEVASFALDWSVPAVPADRARATEQRLRKAFTEAGWELTHDADRQVKGSLTLGFRFQDPATGDQFNLRWYDTTETLFIDAYTRCAHLPAEYLTGSWQSAEWSPRDPA